MADRSACEIQIGGKVRHSKIPGLIKAILLEGVSLEWGEEGLHTSLPKDDLDLAVKKLLESRSDLRGNTLRFCDDQAAWGELPLIEGYCVEEGIPFHRFSEAGDEFEREVKKFRPGMDEPITYIADDSGDPIVSGEPVARLLDLLDKMDSGSGDAEALAEKIRALRTEIRSELPGEIAPMEPFEIVEG